ncbi:MAG TPA: multidrug DMT transporter permease [Planctomycetes bacterium]|nr:multidrug DMT transporter permease [Planctomycetota bacterium]
MFVVQSPEVAVLLCFVTMLCWGSWANTQKLASKEWRFQLFYWDYSIGVLLLSLLFAFTLGSMGSEGRTFLEDLGQASAVSIGWAFLGGVIFNLANILLVAAIDIAGLAVAFPIGIGIALVEGVAVNYINNPAGVDGVMLSLGVAGIVAAIVINAIAYRRLPAQGERTVGKGIAISIIAGVLMGLFYMFVVWSMPEKKDGVLVDAGRMYPYAAVAVFSAGLLASSFIWNSIVMRTPFVGEPVPFGDYFGKGNARLHLIGMLGGMIWNVGMSLNILASERANPSVSYGLGQGATLIAACWGVFVWKEFKAAPAGTGKLLAAMFVSYLAGLALIIWARLGAA